ncbi:cache domain-containing sensor histidine kinase [Paenibacillus hamazuiensis]|uniref:cache domain-containing sensor histidine kinase n=1 Tax=Paenibacillus hamazuiensis TaxID=2936508 RepID=UPI0020105EC6|nr:sensor histidine kinase [Paenibacillus hamazuiensis]
MYQNFIDNLKQNTKGYVLDSLRHADKNLNVFFEDVDHIGSVIVTNKPNVIDELLSPNYEVSYDWFLERKRTEDFLQSLIAYKSFIKRIAVVGENGKIVYTGTPYMDKSLLNRPLIDKIINADGQKVLIKQTAGETGQADTITFGRSIRYNRQVIGVVMIDIDYNVIEHAYDIKTSQGGFVYVIDSNGQFIYNSSSSFPYDNVNGTFLESIYQKALTSSYLEEKILQKELNLIVSYNSITTGWTTIATIPEHNLIQGVAKLRNQIIEGVLLIFIIVLLVSIALSSQITKNLKRLRNTMLWVKKGNLLIPSKITSQDEVGELKEVFESMILQLKQLIEDNKLQEKQKRDAELAALQAQIRPHFLYNTLNTIKYMANIRQADNISEVTASLIDLLRGVLGNTKEFVTLREELDYVRSYMTIQTYKYMNEFSYSIQAEPEILNCKILKFILQPIVENALLHGIGHMQQGGIVSVRVFREGSLMKLEVRDNGKGMHEEQIEKLLQKKGGPAKSGSFSGIGIHNVHERIRMVYGESYGIEIFSQPDLFTVMELTLPLSKGDEDDHVQRDDRRRRAAGQE